MSELDDLKMRWQELKDELREVEHRIWQLNNELFAKKVETLRVTYARARVVWESKGSGKNYDEVRSGVGAYEVLAKWLDDANNRYAYDIVFEDGKATIPHWKAGSDGEWLWCSIWIEEVI